MGRSGPGDGLAMLDPVPDDVGQVLVQGAAARHVERLHAAADREDRHAGGVGLAQERKLEVVELGLGGSELGVDRRAVGARVQVGAARKHEPGHARHERPHALGLDRRQDHRQAAALVDRLGVVEAERDLVLARLALGERAHGLGLPQLGGRDADERSDGGHDGAFYPTTRLVRATMARARFANGRQPWRS